LGVRQTTEALQLARDRGLDLIEIAPLANPPVCKIVDYSKFRYEKEKQRKEANKHNKGGHVKEIRFGLKIGLHDFDTKVRNIKRFLEERDKVRVTVIFRGREMEHKDIGHALVMRMKEQLGDTFIEESGPGMLGNRMHLMLSPKK
jgi:translation initiation factor IF-3